MQLTEATVQALSPDAASFRNAALLVTQSRYLQKHQNADGTVLFGQCAGSGSSVYAVSVTFNADGEPTARCSCPSRKRPCKHALGLLLAHVKELAFPIADLPEALVAQREKAVKRAASAPRKASPRPANRNAETQKRQTQLEGIHHAQKIVESVVTQGLAAINGKALMALRQPVKRLGDYYLPGVQNAFLALLDIFTLTDSELLYTQAYEALTRLYAVLRRGEAYLRQAIDNPDQPRDTTSEIEALLGTVWQLTELAQAGLEQCDVTLVQLAFTCHDDEATARFVDIGVWLDMDSGAVSVTQTVRPYRAVNHIKQEDSCFSLLTLPSVCRYPTAGLNARIRWDATPLMQDITPEVRRQILAHARSDSDAWHKAVRAQLANPLCDKACYLLLHVDEYIENNGVLSARMGDFALPMVDASEQGWPDTVALMTALGRRANGYNALMARVTWCDGRLVGAPLTLVSTTELLRLAY